MCHKLNDKYTLNCTVLGNLLMLNHSWKLVYGKNAQYLSH